MVKGTDGDLRYIANVIVLNLVKHFIPYLAQCSFVGIHQASNWGISYYPSIFSKFVCSCDLSWGEDAISVLMNEK